MKKNNTGKDLTKVFFTVKAVPDYKKEPVKFGFKKALHVFAIIALIVSTLPLPSMVSAHNGMAVSINGGASSTTSLNVTLTLSFTTNSGNNQTPTEMRFVNNSNCPNSNSSTWSAWESYSATKAWVLASGADGSRTVCSQTRHGNDNTIRSDSDSINYSAPAVVPATNPTLGQACGLDIALVLDNSGSISSSELATMKTSLNGFVNSLAPLTPTQFSVTKFSSTASVMQTFSGNATIVNNGVNAVTTSSGHTNWEDGLTVANNTFDPRVGSLHPNLVVFASDGNPNRKIGSTSDIPEADAVSAAVTKANSIKTAGTRILTLGIGSDVNQANMEALSSADAYYSAASFAALPAALEKIATDLCGGTITVNKLIDADGDLQTTNDQTPGQGWSFSVADETRTTDVNGQTSSKEVVPGTYNVGETLVSGYSLLSAACTGQTSGGSKDGNTIYSLVVGNLDIVSCTFINSPNAGTLTVTKRVVNGEAGSAQPGDFAIHINYGNTTQTIHDDGNGTAVSVPANASYSVTEDQTENYSSDTSGAGCSGVMSAGGSATCSVVNTYVPPVATQGSITLTKVVTNDNGGSAIVTDFPLFVGKTSVVSGAANNFDEGSYVISETGDPSHYTASYSGDCNNESHSITVVAGHTYSCTVTNNDIAPSLTLVKHVSGGEASAGRWTLQAFLGDTSEPSLTGAGGAQSGPDFQAGTYTLSESGSVVNYAAGAWVCDGGNQDGNVITVGIGQKVTCSITNTYTPPTTGPDTTFHFIKQLCPAYGDIAGNESAETEDASGHYTEFSNYSTSTPHFPAFTGEVNPEEIPKNCAGASGWNFQVDNNSGMETSSIVGPTNTNGQVDVSYDSLPSNVQASLSSGGQMWVKENMQENYPFGAFRCYQDALKGDNSEYVTLGSNFSSYPKDVYCIAYNIGNVVVTDPALVKTLDNGSPVPGATITYTLVASNNSSVTSTNITVTDPLPSTVTYVSNDNGAVYDATTTTLTWTIASIAPNSTATLHIVATVKADATGSVSNTARITGGADQGNSNTENDSGTASGTVKTGSDGGCTSNCGGGGGGGTSGGGGGGGLPVIPTTQGITLGTSTVTSIVLPEGEILGAATQLPRTGLPEGVWVLTTLAGLAAVWKKKR